MKVYKNSLTFNKGNILIYETPHSRFLKIITKKYNNCFYDYIEFFFHKNHPKENYTKIYKSTFIPFVEKYKRIHKNIYKS